MCSIRIGIALAACGTRGSCGHSARNRRFFGDPCVLCMLRGEVMKWVMSIAISLGIAAASIIVPTLLSYATAGCSGC